MAETVDIICSARNAGPGFSEMIDSVLAQSFRDYRLIIFDDGSDDGFTTRIATEAAARDDRVIVHRNVTSAGLTANLVRGVADSNAEFIARIDAGDLWRPEKLNRQIAAMLEDTSLVVLGTQCEYVSPQGKVLGRSRFAQSDEAIRVAIKRRMGILSHPSIVFRRVLNYRPEFIYSQDLDLYLRASELGRLGCLGDALTICLISRDGITLTRNYLQRKYGALAYRSHYSRIRGGRDVALRVGDSGLEKTFWRIARPFYQRYIDARLEGRPPLVWGAYLAISLILFPPLLIDYARKL